MKRLLPLSLLVNVYLWRDIKTNGNERKPFPLYDCKDINCEICKKNN